MKETKDIKDMTPETLKKMLFVIAMIGLLIYVVFFLPNFIRNISYESVTAKVISVEYRKNGNRKGIDIDFQYEYKNNTYITEQRYSTNNYSVGDKVKIKINPDNPEEKLNSREMIYSGIMLVIDILIIIPIIKQLKKKSNVSKTLEVRG